MKRVIGPGLLGLGVFLLVTAALLRFYAAPALVRIPLDQNVVSVSEATDAAYFDIGSLAVKTGQSLRATRQVQGDVDASSSDTVVLDAYVTLADSTGAKISEATDRVALDRRTAHAVNCCDEEVDGAPARHAGLSYTFPIGTERKTYQFFDTAARKAFPIEYKGTEDVQGLSTYKFEQRIGEQVIEQRTLPGAIIGQPTRLLLTADTVYTNVRTVWVEPSTGAIVKGQEDQLRVFRAEGGPDTVVLDATLAFTDDAVDAAVARAEDSMSKATLVTVVVPLVALVLGLLLALAGAVALFRRSRATEVIEAPEAEAQESEPSHV
jgi:hypothetical protein